MNGRHSTLVNCIRREGFTFLAKPSVAKINKVRKVFRLHVRRAERDPLRVFLSIHNPRQDLSNRFVYLLQI